MSRKWRNEIEQREYQIEIPTIRPIFLLGPSTETW